MTNEILRAGLSRDWGGMGQQEADGTDAPSAPSFVKRHFIQAGDNYYYRKEPEKLAFRTDKASFRIFHVSESVAAATVEIAVARGWSSIEVKGTTEFRRLVWTTAAARGLTVKGYKPTPGEKALLTEEKEGEASPRAESRATGRERERADRPKEKPLSGELVSYGPAPYRYNPENSPSFFVKLKARDGEEATHWGLDLERAREESRAKPGDQVKLLRQNSKSENSTRATWSVRVLGRGGAKIEEVRGTDLQPPTDAPSKITSDFAEKRLPHWEPKDKAALKEKVTKLRSAISGKEQTDNQEHPLPERSR